MSAILSRFPTLGTAISLILIMLQLRLSPLTGFPLQTNCYGTSVKYQPRLETKISIGNVSPVSYNRNSGFFMFNTVSVKIDLLEKPEICLKPLKRKVRL